ncbi:MAG: hypothetical protein V4689_12095 [Verrucomicrobiota bacterium]
MKMSERYDILDHAPKIAAEQIHGLLKRFIEHAVIKPKRDRWLQLSQNPKKLYSKFSGLWNSLDTSIAIEVVNLDSLPDHSYVYYCMDGYGYLLTADQASVVGDAEDGFLFDQESDRVFFLTHEGDYYEYTIPKRI